AEHLRASRIPLGLRGDHSCLGKVAESSDMVLVKMRKDDCPHVIASIAETFKLLRQSFVRLLCILVVVKDEAQDAAVILAMPMCLIGADARIDQHQPFSGMLQQIGVDRYPDEMALVCDEAQQCAQPLPTGKTSVELSIGNFRAAEEQRIDFHRDLQNSTST